jgi:hypothetical protein
LADPQRQVPLSATRQGIETHRPDAICRTGAGALEARMITGSHVLNLFPDI